MQLSQIHTNTRFDWRKNTDNNDTATENKYSKQRKT